MALRGIKKNPGPYFTSYSGGMATIVACNFCSHTERVPCGLHGVGRGYGLAATSTARSRVLAHVKEKHPDEYQKARKEAT